MTTLNTLTGIASLVYPQAFTCAFRPVGPSPRAAVLCCAGTIGGRQRRGMELGELQAVIEATFGERDRARGGGGTFRWFVEEVGEVAKALRDRDPDELRHEVGDALAWLASVANVAGVDLGAAAAPRPAGRPPTRGPPS